MEEKKNTPIKEKEHKPRKDKYDDKLSFGGTFDELMDITIRSKKEVSKENK